MPNKPSIDFLPLARTVPRPSILAGCVFLAAPFAFSAPPELPLMPMPAHIDRGSGELAITRDFRVGVCGVQDPLLTRALARFTDRLQSQTAIFMPRANELADCRDATLTIEARHVTMRPAFGEDESYRLEVTPQSAHLVAPDSAGVLRGLATFAQLVQPGVSAFSAPAAHIDDRPRFPWRGLTLDVSRHWMPMDVVTRNLDAMAAVKLNVFHWHLSDDQGFRVESLVFPKLQQLGSEGHFYTQAQIRDVIRYAADRGIRVVPEFDLPGHASSLLTAYPELGSAPGPYHVEHDWGVFKPVLNPTNEATYRFLDRFVGEMAALFPDPYFHIGGDEVEDAQWKANPQIQQFMRARGIASSIALHEYFNSRMREILTRHGKKMVGWDEILTPDLPKDAVIQSWRGQQALAAAARRGYQGLLSFGFYLDQMQPASYHYENDPLGGEAKTLSPQEAAHILGGEACMWTEYVSPETVDSRIWPRLAAIAERLWSPRDLTGIDSMYARLELVNRNLQWTGIHHLSAQERVLDRMAADRLEKTLSVIANSVEAAGIHDRYPSHKYNSIEPLNRLVDAARAESEWVRHLTLDARAVVSSGDSSARDRLGVAFQNWRDASGDLAASTAPTFLAAEAAPVAAILSSLGDTGARALQYLANREEPPPGWVDAQRPLLAKAESLTAEVRVSGARPVRILLEALQANSSPTVLSGSAKK